MNQLNRYAGPIIDSHIHLFDPTRPQGIPWPVEGDEIYAPAMPPHFHALADRHGVAGAVVVEASPWVDDNYWVIETIRDEPLLLGFVGNLHPCDPYFNHHLDRLLKERKFLGLRHGNLWERDLMADMERAGFIDGLRQLADAGRTLDSANPDLRLLEGLCDLVEAIPSLKIVIDHLPNAKTTRAEQKSFLDRLEQLSQSPSVMIKLSEVPQLGPFSGILDSSVYTEHISQLLALFGEDRCLFGSDWPNSEHIASYSETLDLTRDCLSHLSEQAKRKCFYDNAIKAYSLDVVSS